MIAAHLAMEMMSWLSLEHLESCNVMVSLLLIPEWKVKCLCTLSFVCHDVQVFLVEESFGALRGLREVRMKRPVEGRRYEHNLSSLYFGLVLELKLSKVLGMQFRVDVFDDHGKPSHVDELFYSGNSSVVS